jgi:UDP-2,3-diacylglucosamine hydrolase
MTAIYAGENNNVRTKVLSFYHTVQGDFNPSKSRLCLLFSLRHNTNMTDTPRKYIHIALIAGWGELPVCMAKQILQQYPDCFLSVYLLDHSQEKALKALAHQMKPIQVGRVEKTLAYLEQDHIEAVLFAGKVNKWMMLKNPYLDQTALALWRSLEQFNDDAIMLKLIEMIEKRGMTVLPQADYLQPLFISAGCYSLQTPSVEQRRDIEIGLTLAKEMGRLDIGQTVIIAKGMVIAVEAIEGTDQAIRRSKKWITPRQGVVVKVEKPQQDTRFDIPTVGLQTLKTMKQSGCSVLAVEADKTLVLQLPDMQAYANRHHMVLVAV